VTHCSNSVAGAFYNNKFESFETPTRTETVSVNCIVYLSVRWWPKQKSLDFGEISAVMVHLGVGQLLTHCTMRIISVIYSAVRNRLHKHYRPKCKTNMVLAEYNNNARPQKIK